MRAPSRASTTPAFGRLRRAPSSSDATDCEPRALGLGRAPPLRDRRGPDRGRGARAARPRRMPTARPRAPPGAPRGVARRSPSAAAAAATRRSSSAASSPATWPSAPASPLASSAPTSRSAAIRARSPSSRSRSLSAARTSSRSALQALVGPARSRPPRAAPRRAGRRAPPARRRATASALAALPPSSRSSRARASRVSSSGGSLPPVTAPSASTASPAGVTTVMGCGASRQMRSASSRSSARSTWPSTRLGQRPVIGIDLDLLDQPPSRRHDHRRPPLRIVRDDRGAAGAFPAEPADRLDRRASYRAARSGRVACRAPPRRRARGAPARAAPRPAAPRARRSRPSRLATPRVHPSYRACSSRSDSIRERSWVTRSRASAQACAPRALVGGERRRRLDQRTASALHARALRLQPVQALPERIPRRARSPPAAPRALAARSSSCRR